MKKQKCTKGVTCTTCKAEDFLSAAQREKLDAYNDNGGDQSDLPLATRRLLEGQK